VQHRIDKTGGAIAFVDDYTAWVMGPTAESNQAGIRAIIDRAIDWEKRSGATFEAEKTAIIHFSRRASRVNKTPFVIKGQTVQPKAQVKVLGVIMDAELRFREHIARASSRAMEAAMELKRLSGLPPRVARQLFTATVAPVMDYASNVWMYACGDRLIKAVNRVQRIGAQAIVGTFNSVATAVAEAEANILPARERFARRATKLWMDIRTLPSSHPLRTVGFQMFKRFVSPIQQLASIHREIPIDRLETIQAFAIAPWEVRIETNTQNDDKSAELANAAWAVRIATSSSVRNGKVGLGGSIRVPPSLAWGDDTTTVSLTLGTRQEQNPYTAELGAIAVALRALPPETTHRRIVVSTRNKAVVQSLSKPWQQSGQGVIGHIYIAVKELRTKGNKITVIWKPTDDEFSLARKAKEAARRSTEDNSSPFKRCFRAKSTTLNNARRKLQKVPKLPENVGAYSKTVDTALPGKHTRILYDGCSSKEAKILSQLRSGMARVNAYLHQIGAALSAECACGQALETIEHFLLRCTKWTSYRTQILQTTGTGRSNLSLCLGGKSRTDPDDWTPDVDAVRRTIKFAMATKRLQEG
jgi:ribonuclease HI